MIHYAKILWLCGLMAVSAINPLAPPTRAADLTRTHTESMSFAGQHDDPARLVNTQVALKQLQRFFDNVQFQPGVEYSFIHDVLQDSLSHSRGFVETRSGSFGNGISSVASLLNALVHQARFWDKNGTPQTVFEEVNAKSVKNDSAIGAYSVLIFLDPGNVRSYDYVWRLNPTYSGPPPRIVARFDETTYTASLTVTYADQTPPPEAVRSSHDAALLATLCTLIGDRRLGFTLIPINNPQAEININENAQVPSASAWKGAAVVYFFEKISPDIWRSVPIRYWNTRNVRRVPVEYQDAWLKYHEILRWVYVMTVFSGNHEAANVLAYIYDNAPHEPNRNPVQSFNDWARQSLGISSESGLFSWQYGRLASSNIIDTRFAGRRIVEGGQELFYSATFSAHDFALIYYHLATVGSQRGYYDKAVELLSIRTDIVSKIEGQVADHPEIQTATKDGYFSPSSENSLGHDVNNDAGLLIFPDGRRYAIAFTAFDAVDIESDVVGVVMRALIDNQVATASISR
jgi:hypothetical protein